MVMKYRFSSTDSTLEWNKFMLSVNYMVWWSLNFQVKVFFEMQEESTKYMT